MNRYLKYRLEDFLEDDDFVQWILNGKNDHYWENLISEDPDFKEKSQEAKELILLLADTDSIADDDKWKIWKNIEHYQELFQRQHRTITLRKIISYAAIVLLIVSVSTVTWYFSMPSRKYEFASVNLIPADTDPRLILSTGEVFDLKKDNSSVVVTGNRTILINDEQSVDLLESEKPAEKLMNEVIIPYGSKSMLTLGDGTKVWLNAGSKLAFPTVFTGVRRVVYMEGDAYFEVAHDPGKPFIVNAGEVSLNVLGTRFYLSSYSSEEEVIAVLMEGSVAIRENSAFKLSRNEALLEPGQKAIYTRNNKEISVKEESDPDIYIAWTAGWFQFDKESLYTVFRKLERYYDIDIVYDVTFVSDDMISGKLDLKDSIPDVMRTLARLADISYRIDNGKIYIDK
jgi:transmembrane sensor